jgi:hypothetical protein
MPDEDHELEDVVVVLRGSAFQRNHSTGCAMVTAHTDP